MSIQDYKREREALRALHEELKQGPPRAWLLVANCIFARAEDFDPLAIFDTREQAEAYEKAARLFPKTSDGSDGVRTRDGMFRRYRPDSLLWNYNPDIMIGQESMAVPVWAVMGVGNLPENPEPPSTPLNIENIKSLDG